ncbi:TolC family outer membrane protein [Pseudohaliea rubra]|uniref:Agglutination protein n=1 Tax=Pseudohaliea rubra DSM 19751 TaxID=1265313 RepID=A0A095WZ76_9GAMM|nr:TolC family outer membrane protein [Pseudohaliea rubra]KGE03944.1 Agglutination protein [Pseudohaliea rubra DSM 19751]
MSQLQHHAKRLLCAAIGIALAGQAVAQDVPTDFRSAVNQAVNSNPRVTAEYYNFEASRESERAARGGYLPSVDLSSEIGREQRDTPLVDLGSYTRDATRFTVTQMLFDGFETRNTVATRNFEKLSQYYNLRSISEAVGLEAAQAYLDTLRFQQLVTFAEDNYVYHRQIYNRIQERASGGVSQGVDLQQAEARIALAESNLVTELQNLHDVRARYQRVIGDLPAEGLSMPTLPDALIPALRGAALDVAYSRSPVINAAIENLRASQEFLNARNAPFMPRIDLRYRNEVEHDTDGFDGTYDEEAIELVMNYNLFRGGSDSARKREAYALYNAAMEERKQACINVRQETMIAFNDIQALTEQVQLLERNLASQDQTRRAYQDQFDIGQRTLLDLLDSQNEFFDTQRAYITAQTNLIAARAETLANMGLLLAALELDGLNAEQIEALKLDFSRDPDDENAQPLCPPEPPPGIDIDRASLFDRLDKRAANGGGATEESKAALAAMASGSSTFVPAGSNMYEAEVDVTFAIDSAEITSEFDEEIRRAGAFLREHPDVEAIIEGHTCNMGEESYNEWLSQQRADAVRSKLVEDYGVDPAQVVAVGRGEGAPKADNSTAEGRERNRRVEIVLSAN